MSSWIKRVRIVAASLGAALTATIAVAHATTYYVSAAGNDANDGLSTTAPWQTINKVNAARFLAGQSLAFRGGDSFVGCLVISGTTNLQASSATNPFTVTSYGTGAARIAANCPGHDIGNLGPKSAAVRIDSVSGVIWNNVNVSANGSVTQYGILIQSGSGNTSSKITVENSVISGFHLDNAATGDNSSEISLLGYATNGACGPLSHITIMNNTLQGELGPTSPDDAGIDGYGCNAAANILNISNVLYQGNTVLNLGGRPNIASGYGILLNSVNGGVAQYNIVHDVGANVTTCGGPGGIYDYNANNVKIQFNEVYRMTFSRSGGAQPCDAVAYDIDNGTTNTLVQYNYSHDNMGPGIETTTAPTNAVTKWGPNTIRYNVSENDSQGTISTGGGGIQIGGAGAKPSIINVYNNTVYLSANASIVPACISFLVTPTGGVVANNLCWMGSTFALFYDFGGQTPTGVSFLNNEFFSPTQNFQVYSYGNSNYASFADWATVPTGNEQGSITVHPLFSAAAPVGTCTWSPTSKTGPQPCPASYQLSPNSPPEGTGLDLTKAPYRLDVGTRDYYGHAIPNATGSGYNIGADGAAE